ncbi:hypothetical protein Q5752_002710 [Cryptotrichosporon argae]
MKAELSLAVALLAYAAHAWWTWRARLLARAKARRLSEESFKPIPVEVEKLGGRRNRTEQRRREEGTREAEQRAAEAEMDEATARQLALDKELYHKLQNLEDHPDALALAQTRLVELLDHTLHAARASPASGILSISDYSPTALKAYFDAAHATNTEKYEAYLARRRAGGARELFTSRAHAAHWLAQAAPVKYVDGGWLGTVLTPSCAHRQAARLAWQVISEESGDGDLDKNHVYVYHRLIESLAASGELGSAPRGDDAALVDAPAAARCYTAAVAQQCVGLLAADYLPEALGFNMAYETLPYHLLVTVRELKELGIDNYYFALHVTIDNPDSGHAALSRVAVERYLLDVQETQGEAAAVRAWRKVQAGVVLADGLPTTPCAPVDPTTPSSDTETAVADLMARKSAAAAKMHCPSRATIGGLTIEQWLDPAAMTAQRALDFTRALAQARPWVYAGQASRSRLVRELEWGGRMFGAFSRDETRLVKEWVESLGQRNRIVAAPGEYAAFVGEDSDAKRQVPPGRFAALAADLLRPAAPAAPADLTLDTAAPPSSPRSRAAVYTTLLSLLDHFPLAPAKFATPLGARVLRVLRAQLGFPALHETADICAGMDGAIDAGEGLWELGTALFARQGVEVASYADLARDVEAEDAATATTCAQLLELRQRPYANQALLLGLSCGFTRLLQNAPWRAAERAKVEQMRADALVALGEVAVAADSAWRAEYERGAAIAQRVVAW